MNCATYASNSRKSSELKKSSRWRPLSNVRKIPHSWDVLPTNGRTTLTLSWPGIGLALSKKSRKAASNAASWPFLMTRIACVLTGCEVINQQDTRLAPSSASTLQAASCTQPEEGESQQESCKAKKEATPKKPAKGKAKSAARSGSKAEKVLELMRRKEGATLAEIAQATNRD